MALRLAIATLCMAVVTGALLAKRSALAAKSEYVGFHAAIEAAGRPLPTLPATDIVLRSELDPPIYEVTLLGGDGVYGVRVDARTGNVLGISMARVVPRSGAFHLLQPEELRRAHVTLDDAIDTSVRVLGAEGLREVALAGWNGKVVIEVVHIANGEGVGHLLDAHTGRILVGTPPGVAPPTS